MLEVPIQDYQDWTTIDLTKYVDKYLDIEVTPIVKFMKASKFVGYTVPVRHGDKLSEDNILSSFQEVAE